MDPLEAYACKLQAQAQRAANLHAAKIVAQENEYLRSLKWEGDEFQRFNDRRDGVIARLERYKTSRPCR
jgi:hypothetical protein